MNRGNTIAVVVLLCTVPPRCFAEKPAAKTIAADVAAVVKGNNEFATDLYARLRSDAPGNLFFSPYSISSALAMTSAGAHGETEAQMAKVLHFPASQARLHAGFKSLGDQIAASAKAGFQLRVANRLWGQQGFHFLPEFLAVTRANYGAELGLLDFKQSAAARTTINSWIEQQTNGKIRDLLPADAIREMTQLVLTNAIYFRARWTHEFEPSATADVPFHVSASKQVAVPTMRQTGEFLYAKTDDVQVLELHYGPSGDLAMLILLPGKTDGLADLERRLTGASLEKWSRELMPCRVKIDLPKFKMTSEVSLADALASMGMPLAFSENQADFSRMSKQRLSLSAVFHQAYVDVNEEGTEAAAATAILAEEAKKQPSDEEIVEFRADHPFVFVIRDARTQSILFLGRLTDPSQK